VNQTLVQQFHRAFGVKAAKKPTIPDRDIRNLRLRLIKEEFQEVTEALLAPTEDPRYLEEVAKEMADLLYVVYGTADVMGIPLDEVFAEVHASNMSKLGEDGKPIYRPDGKVLKGPSYRIAKVKAILEQAS
jgi:predicted HAD superfamily Cof-like phosphohydrolase